MYACLSPAFLACCEFCKTSHSCFVCFFVCCMWTCIWAWEQDSMLHPSEVPADHVLFIQSASVNRHVLPGVKLLLINKRSAEHTSELQSLMRISYVVFCLTQ